MQVRAFTSQAVKSGVDIFRVFDSLNYMDNLKFGKSLRQRELQMFVLACSCTPTIMTNVLSQSKPLSIGAPSTLHNCVGLEVCIWACRHGCRGRRGWHR